MSLSTPEKTTNPEAENITTSQALKKLALEVEKTKDYNQKISEYCRIHKVQACFDSFGRCLTLIDKAGKSTVLKNTDFVLKKEEENDRTTAYTNLITLENMNWEAPNIEVRTFFEKKGYKVGYKSDVGMSFSNGGQKMLLKKGMYALENGSCMVSQPVLDMLLRTEKKQGLLNDFTQPAFVKEFGKSDWEMLTEQGVRNDVHPYLLFALLKTQQNSRDSLQDTVGDVARCSGSICRRIKSAEWAYEQKTGYAPKQNDLYQEGFLYYFLGVEEGNFSVDRAQKVYAQYRKYAQK